MKSSNYKSIGLGLAAGVLVIAFNNCAQKLNGYDGEVSMSSVAVDNSKMPIVADQQEPVIQVDHTALVNSAAAQTANHSLLDVFNQAKLFTSNSANGPFVENGAVCKGQASYFKMVGLSSLTNFKGCASPSAALGCLDVTKHRSFLANEFVGGNVVTVVSVAESNSYPAGDYSFFVSGANGNTNIIHKVGTATFKTCSGTPAPAPRTCNFRITNPQFVVGGGVNVYPFVCNEANNGKTGIIHYEAGASSKDFNAICECK